MKSKIFFTISLLLGLLFINAGLNKFLNYMPMPNNLPKEMVELMEAIKTFQWLLPLIGFAEVLGGLLLLLPRLRTLGSLVLLPVSTGILLTNTITDPSGIVLGLIVFTINILFLYDGKEKLKSLF